MILIFILHRFMMTRLFDVCTVRLLEFSVGAFTHVDQLLIVINNFP
jgi:hypothetical protein